MHVVQAGPVSAVSEKLKFSDPVKTGTTGILPKVSAPALFGHCSMIWQQQLKNLQHSSAVHTCAKRDSAMIAYGIVDD